MDAHDELVALADVASAIREVGGRLAVDDETVAGAGYAIARAIDRLADTIADGMKVPRQPRRVV